MSENRSKRNIKVNTNIVKPDNTTKNTKTNTASGAVSGTSADAAADVSKNTAKNAPAASKEKSTGPVIRLNTKAIKEQNAGVDEAAAASIKNEVKPDEIKVEPVRPKKTSKNTRKKKEDNAEPQQQDNKDNKSEDKKPAKTKAEGSKTGEAKTKKTKTGKIKTGGSKPDENKTDKGKADESKTNESKTIEGKTIEVKTGESKSGENKTDSDAPKIKKSPAIRLNTRIIKPSDIEAEKKRAAEEKAAAEKAAAEKAAAEAKEKETGKAASEEKDNASDKEVNRRPSSDRHEDTDRPSSRHHRHYDEYDDYDDYYDYEEEPERKFFDLDAIIEGFKMRATNEALIAWTLVLIGSIVFISLVFNNNIWLDEAFTATLVNTDMAGVLERSMADTLPPLYNVLLKLTTSLFGYTIPVMKFTSTIPMILTMIMGATVVRRRFGDLASYIFILAVIVMPNMLFYGVEIRMYSLGFLFVTAAGVYACEVLIDPRLKNWILFTLFGILAGYSHHFAFVTVGFVYLGLLIHAIIRHMNSDDEDDDDADIAHLIYRYEHEYEDIYSSKSKHKASKEDYDHDYKEDDEETEDGKETGSKEDEPVESAGEEAADNGGEVEDSSDEAGDDGTDDEDEAGDNEDEDEAVDDGDEAKDSKGKDEPDKADHKEKYVGEARRRDSIHDHRDHHEHHHHDSHHDDREHHRHHEYYEDHDYHEHRRHHDDHDHYEHRRHHDDHDHYEHRRHHDDHDYYEHSRHHDDHGYHGHHEHYEHYEHHGHHGHHEHRGHYYEGSGIFEKLNSKYPVNIKNFLICLAATFVLYVPCLIITAEQFGRVSSYFSMPDVTFKVFIKYCRYPFTVGFLPFTILLFAVCIALLVHSFMRRHKSTKDWFMMYCFVIYYGVLLFGTLLSKIMTANIFVDRYLFFALGLIWLFFATEAGSLKKPLVYGILVLELLTGIYSYTQAHASEYAPDPDETIKWLKDNVEDGDSLYTLEDYEELAWCLTFYRNGLTNYETFDEAVIKAGSGNVWIAVMDGYENEAPADLPEGNLGYAAYVSEIENAGYTMEYVGTLRFDRYRLKMYKLLRNEFIVTKNP